MTELVHPSEVNDSSHEVKDTPKEAEDGLNTERDSKVVETKLNDNCKEKAAGMQGASADKCEHEDLIYIPEDLKHSTDGEDIVIMTGEEMRNYLLEKIAEYMKDPKINPLLALKKRTEDLKEKIRQTLEEFKGVSKCLDQMGQDHLKFLRYKGILPKVPKRDSCVSADFPPLPNVGPPPPADSSEVLKFRVDPSTLEIGRLKEITPTQSGRVTILPASVPLVASNVVRKNVPKLASSQPVECIDLTDDSGIVISDLNSLSCSKTTSSQHPAPLPVIRNLKQNKQLPPPPPKLQLRICASKNGIILQWDFPRGVVCGNLDSFEIFGYQEQTNVKVSGLSWRKLAIVKAEKLPMAATLKQFVEGFRYNFSIRAIDIYGQLGSFSDPASILFELQKSKAENNA